LGQPVIQGPQDMMALQKVIPEAKPNLIIETGIAHGDPLYFLHLCLNFLVGREKLFVWIEIYEHITEKNESYPMVKRITMLEGDITSSKIAEKVYSIAKNIRKSQCFLIPITPTNMFSGN